MRQKTMLALALLLLASPLLALAAPPDGPLPLPGSAALSTAAPLALCAAPTTAVPQGLSPNPVTELGVGEAVVTCSPNCSHNQCLGQPAGMWCNYGPGKVGTCTLSTYCSVDGIRGCACIWKPDA